LKLHIQKIISIKDFLSSVQEIVVLSIDNFYHPLKSSPLNWRTPNPMQKENHIFESFYW